MVELEKCPGLHCGCDNVKDKWECWFEEPENGYCPYIQSNIDIIRKRRGKSISSSSGYRQAVERFMGRRVIYKPGQSCGHPGCLSHVTHPCEGCGRIAGH